MHQPERCRMHQPDLSTQLNPPKVLRVPVRGSVWVAVDRVKPAYGATDDVWR
jgi:hypothetical protein